MKERAFTKKASVWKKAAACALAAVFLLSACGMAKDTSSSYDTSPTYQNSAMSGGGSYAPQAYEEAASEESYEREEAMEIADDYDTPMAAADGDEAVNVNDGGSSSDSEDGAVEQADLKSSNRKIVYTGNISLQSLEYDASVKSIHDKITQCGGFIENEDTYNNDPYWYYTERTGAAANRTRRTLSLTARIPAEKFDAFMKDLENDGQVTNTSISARNISVSYANHDASRKALEIEQKRLLEMMDKADTVEDMIAVEERLTEVERELGNEKTTLSAMDRDVDFSTVYISLEEVFEYSEKVVEVTYGERLQRAFGRAIDGFVTFWEELLLFIVETFPFPLSCASSAADAEEKWNSALWRKKSAERPWRQESPICLLILMEREAFSAAAKKILLTPRLLSVRQRRPPVPRRPALGQMRTPAPLRPALRQILTLILLRFNDKWGTCFVYTCDRRQRQRKK